MPLQTFHLYENLITGAIPKDFNNLTKIDITNIEINSICPFYIQQIRLFEYFSYLKILHLSYKIYIIILCIFHII